MSDDILVRMTAAAHEEVIFHRDADSGLEVIVAIHSTLLGPALGGTRWQPYTNEAAALEDVLRLAEAMTAKSALVGLPFGGGKAVVIGDPDQKRPEALRAYARFIDRLGGRFWTTTDVGTTTAEIDEMRRHTEYVVGTSAAQGGTGDTSELTAVSVVAGMRAAMESTFGTDSFAGRRLVVLGTGKVGSRIARLAANEGAHVVVADVREEVAAALAREIDGETSAAATAHALDCDVLSPNGLGGVLNPASIPELRCRVVCGAANNQLANDPADAALLASRGILYAPDYVVNSGGVISVTAGWEGGSAESARALAEAVRETTARVIALAEAEEFTTAAAAARLVAERLAASRERDTNPQTSPRRPSYST